MNTVVTGASSVVNEKLKSSIRWSGPSLLSASEMPDAWTMTVQPVAYGSGASGFRVNTVNGPLIGANGCDPPQSIVNAPGVAVTLSLNDTDTLVFTCTCVSPFA